jgi:hypothetical protein
MNKAGDSGASERPAAMSDFARPKFARPAGRPGILEAPFPAHPNARDAMSESRRPIPRGRHPIGASGR